MEMEMPKMKTKSAAKKRFSFTASGRVKAGVAGKRHGMIKRTTKFIRDHDPERFRCENRQEIHALRPVRRSAYVPRQIR
jgi:large subunit ribosomal protein L35